MTTHTIKEGNHYSDKFFFTLPWIDSPSITRYVRFQEDCRYIMPAYYQDNVNKLFGLQFGVKIWKDLSGTWDVGVHWNSARFGWRWSESNQCIELLAYVYRKGIRNWDEQMRFPVVAQVKLGDVIMLRIVSDKDNYYFYSQKNSEEQKCFTVAHQPQTQLFGLTHSLMFGGTPTAPHTMHVEISKNKF